MNQPVSSVRALCLVAAICTLASLLPASAAELRPNLFSNPSFEQGDPDRPIITGCLYHAHNPPPFGQPDNKSRAGFRTRSTPGGGGYSELSFEDRRGAEVLRLRAERELREVVGQDRLSRVGRVAGLQLLR